MSPDAATRLRSASIRSIFSGRSRPGVSGKVLYFAGSPVANRVPRIAPGYAPVPLDTADAHRVADLEGAVLLATVAELGAAHELRERAPGIEVLLAVETGCAAPALPDFVHGVVAADFPESVQARIVEETFRFARARVENQRAQHDLTKLALELTELNNIGVRLSAERDTDSLLELILTKAREITRSDAGSIYLVEEGESGERLLRFKLAQNDSLTVPFREFTLPISHRSLAGHVALTGEIRNLEDAYAPPPGSPFEINQAFDRQIGYRTKSMLVVPLKTPQGEITGIFQLINRKPAGLARFGSPEEIEEKAISFSERAEELAASLASQAAVALENNRLYRSIETLFEGFVTASVAAIEARDPTTAGHSFRVADLTVALAGILDRTDAGPYAGVRFNADEMKELRYAAILHDFGKVGVRDDVLVKAKKLYPGQLELVAQRAEVIRRGIELRNAHRKIEILLTEGRDRFLEQLGVLDEEMARLAAEVDEFVKVATAANEPTVMPEATPAALQHMTLRKFEDHTGQRRAILTAHEAWVLSIPKGSLTQEERREIESHVSLTYNFLKQIPWTQGLRRVADIAHAHHERLNGQGYPLQLAADAIPVQSKLMMIADVYDALTAADRPYKKAVPVHRALDILLHDRNSGALDPHLVDLFIGEKVYLRTTPRP